MNALSPSKNSHCQFQVCFESPFQATFRLLAKATAGFSAQLAVRTDVWIVTPFLRFVYSHFLTLLEAVVGAFLQLPTFKETKSLAKLPNLNHESSNNKEQVTSKWTLRCPSMTLNVPI